VNTSGITNGQGASNVVPPDPHPAQTEGIDGVSITACPTLVNVFGASAPPATITVSWVIRTSFTKCATLEVENGFGFRTNLPNRQLRSD
jgi:hypothetical protein